MEASEQFVKFVQIAISHIVLVFPYHIETIQLIFSPNLLTGFYIIVTVKTHSRYVTIFGILKFFKNDEKCFLFDLKIYFRSREI